MTKFIPDVSHHRYITDWSKVKDSVDFLLAKATQRTNFIDPTLDDFIAGCEKNNIPYWLYCYLEKGNELAQTKYMVETCKGKIGANFVGWALDFERENSTEDILKCIDYIVGLGEKCLVYGKCALTAVKQRYGDMVGFWYARYGKNTGIYDPSYPVKSMYAPYTDLHQYTSLGTCPGTSGKGDMNRLTGKRDLSWFTTRAGREVKKDEDKTVITVGSARIDENGKIKGGKAGDQTDKEVSEQPFYMHSKGWLGFRPKSVSVANKTAQGMKDACANNNIGYDQANRCMVKMIQKYGSPAAVEEKTETDCSDLVRSIILYATGIDVGSFSTASEPAVLRKSGLFDEITVKSANDVKNGDILVTKTKGHTVIVTGGSQRTREKEQEKKPTDTKKTYSGDFPKLPSRGYFKNGDVSAEVCKLKKFLNWYGNYKLDEKNKNYFDTTEKCVRDFQKREGLVQDGKFGKNSLAKAKKVKK